jgi:periplasmic protein TonB
MSGFAKTPVMQNRIVESKPGLDTVPAVDSTEGKIYEAVEVEAYFPGGEQSWRSYLEQNLNPMVPITNKAPAGLYTVYIQFVVDLDGKVSAIKALTKHGYGMEAEVMRILRKSPPWVPAVQYGKKVRAYRKQPVTFQVEEEKKKKRRKDD